MKKTPEQGKNYPGQHSLKNCGPSEINTREVLIFGDHLCRYHTDISDPDGFLPCESKMRSAHENREESMRKAEFLSDEDEEQDPDSCINVTTSSE